MNNIRLTRKKPIDLDLTSLPNNHSQRPVIHQLKQANISFFTTSKPKILNVNYNSSISVPKPPLFPSPNHNIQILSQQFSYDPLNPKRIVPQRKKLFQSFSGSVQKEEKVSNLPTRRLSNSLRLKLKPNNDYVQYDKQERQEQYKNIRFEFLCLVNSSNKISVKNENNMFRAYIQKGNNGNLVQEMLKKRWWWSIETKDIKKANLIWTQWINPNVVAELSSPLTKFYISELQYNQIYQKCSQQYLPWQYRIKKLISKQHYQIVKKNIQQSGQTCLQKKSIYFKKSKKSLSLYENLTFTKQKQEQRIIHNHVEGCLNLHSKRILFMNLFTYFQKKQIDPFKYLPMTFIIDKLDESQAIDQLNNEYDQIQRRNNEKNIWIIKPGENSNRGYGIVVVKEKDHLFKELSSRLQGNTSSTYKRSVIVQKYIQNCFLINKRKFDIRCYVLITTVNGVLKAYWFEDGYIRTSSQQFSLQNTSNLMIHLTNDAIQKKGQGYGKFQDANKISFAWFKNYLKKNGFKNSQFQETYQTMKKIGFYMVSSAAPKIKRKQYSFQLFGLDFMLDKQLNPYLIEANSNPCLDSSGIILCKLIHQLVQNVIMIAIDPLFPQPTNSKKRKGPLYKDYFQNNKFSLIYCDKVQVINEIKSEKKFIQQQV